MGNGSSKPSDLFYPDNPKRRARASQLKDDIEHYCTEFKDLQRRRDEILKELKPRLPQFLKKYGYNSPEELDQAVKDILKGPALSEYIRVSEQVDKQDELVSTIFQIIGVISVASGVFLGGLVVLGIMTGGTALAAIGAIGLVLAAVAGIAFLFGIYEGAVERSNMRQCIHDLAHERVKARAAVEGMKAIFKWVSNIKLWLDEPLISENPEIMKKKIEGDFTNDFSKSKRPYVVQYLDGQDRERGAWTNEDPNWRSGPYDVLPVGTRSAFFSEQFLAKHEPYYHIPSRKGTEPQEVFPDFVDSTSKIDIEYTSKESSGFLQLIFLSSNKTSCTALGPNDDTWTITYESGLHDGEKPRLEDLKFSLKNLTNEILLKGCTLDLLAYTVS